MDSPAAEAGLMAGDVIVKVGDEEVESAGDVHEAMAETEADQKTTVTVIRKGDRKSLDITLGEMPENSFSKHMEFIGEGNDHFSIHTAPRMMKHSGGHGDVDVRVIRRGGSHGVKHMELKELHEADGELKEMRSELDKMQKELKEMQEELKK